MHVCLFFNIFFLDHLQVLLCNSLSTLKYIHVCLFLNIFFLIICRSCSATHIKGKNCVGSAVNFQGWDDMIVRFDSFKPPQGLTIPVGREAAHKYLLIEVHFKQIVKGMRLLCYNCSTQHNKQLSSKID